MFSWRQWVWLLVYSAASWKLPIASTWDSLLTTSDLRQQRSEGILSGSSRPSSEDGGQRTALEPACPVHHLPLSQAMPGALELTQNQENKKIGKSWGEYEKGGTVEC